MSWPHCIWIGVTVTIIIVLGGALFLGGFLLTFFLVQRIFKSNSDSVTGLTAVGIYLFLICSIAFAIACHSHPGAFVLR